MGLNIRNGKESQDKKYTDKKKLTSSIEKTQNDIIKF